MRVRFCKLAFLVSVTVGLSSTVNLFGVAIDEVRPHSYDWWYADGVLIVNFSEEVSKAGFRTDPGHEKTGLASLDNLFTKYNVQAFEQLFSGSKRLVDRNQVDLSNYYRITLDKNKSLDQAFSEFSADPYIEHVEKVGVHPVMVTPNDPNFGAQWGYNQANDQDVDCPEAWNTETGDSAILVGAMDTGVQWDHPDLAGAAPYINGNIWINWAEYYGTADFDDDTNGFVDDIRGWDFVNVGDVWPGEDGWDIDNDPMDFNGHGTHTSGTMAAITNNGIGGAGMAGGWGSGSKGCRIVPLRIGWSQAHPVYGYEAGYVRMDFAAQAFYYATSLGVTAVNCSWGSSNSGGIGAAIDNAVANGMLIVSSAGNDNTQTASYLCGRADVLAVASLSSSGQKSGFSNYGTWVDVSAPGSSIYSTYSSHGTPTYTYLSGTSMASPHVTGLAGLLRSALPTISRSDLSALIIATTDNINALNPSYIGKLGSGRINARAALIDLFKPQVSATPRFGPSPISVDFNGSSAIPIDTWLWHFGDGDSAFGQAVSHQYLNPGTFDVNLKATGPQGENATLLPEYVIAYADTFTMEDFSGTIEDPLVVELSLTNYAPISEMSIPIYYGGQADISLDSVSKVGTRGTAFESAVIFSSSSATFKALLRLTADAGGGSPPLAPGSGAILKLYFHYDVGPPIPADNTLDTTTFNGSLSFETPLGNFLPVVNPGTIHIHAFRGDANNSGFISISDVIFLIQYVFQNGPAPDPVAGDADSNGFINITDIVYLVAYIFNGGPPP